MREVEAISFLVGISPKPKGSSFSWLAKTHDGNQISLYYDVSRPKRDHHWVEAYDPSKHLGLPTSQDGVVGIDIVDLPKYFTK